MKIRYFPAAVIATATFSVFPFATSSVAQNSTFGPVPPPSNPPPLVERVQLSGGAEDVLKLSRAKVNEEVIVAFVQSGNRHFSLSASEILHLRKEGVSDRVLTAMLGQTPPPPTPPPAVSEPAFSAEASAPQYVSPPATTSYVETAPVSTVYVGTPSYYSYYDPWPYWSSWYPYPAFAFGFYWGWGWGGCGYWSYPSYCYPNYCYNGSWNNYCNNGYSSAAATRPQAPNNAALVSEMRQPSGVSRERPLVSEMRQPSGVNQRTPLVSEGRQPSGVGGANQTAARNGFDRTENRSASGSKPTSYWSGGNGNRPTKPSVEGSQAAAPTRTSGIVNSRTPSARPVESRSATQFTGGNSRPNPTGVSTGGANQRPAAPSYVNPSAGSLSRSSGSISRSPSSTWSRPASPTPTRSMSSPTANYQRSSSPSYRSSGNLGGASRPSMSPSFSSRGSSGGGGFSGGGSRSMASGSGGFRGGGMGGGGGGGRPR